MSCLSASSTPQANVGSMNTVSRFCVSRTFTRASRFWYSGWFANRSTFISDAGSTPSGNLAAEQQIQATRLDDRVERRVRDEVVDPFAHDRPGALAVADHLHAAALELLGQVPGERVERLVVVVVDVDRLVVQCHCVLSSFQRREVGRALLEEARDALDEVGPLHRLVHQLLGAVAGLEDIAHGVCVHLLLDHR